MKSDRAPWLSFLIFVVLISFIFIFAIGNDFSRILRILGGGIFGGNEWNEWIGFLVLIMIIAYFAFEGAKASSVKNKNAKKWSFDWWANQTSKLYDWFFIDAVVIYVVYAVLGFALYFTLILFTVLLNSLLHSELLSSLMSILALNSIEPVELRMILFILLWTLMAQAVCRLLRIDRIIKQRVMRKFQRE